MPEPAEVLGLRSTSALGKATETGDPWKGPEKAAETRVEGRDLIALQVA